MRDLHEGDVVVIPSGERATFLRYDREGLCELRCLTSRRLLTLPRSVLHRWQAGRNPPTPVRMGAA